MKATSMKKYRKLHDMDDLPPGASKEDMIPAVAKHFSQQVSVHIKPYLMFTPLTPFVPCAQVLVVCLSTQVVDEKDTLVNFALSLKRHYLQTRQSPQQPMKKPRNATKVKAR